MRYKEEIEKHESNHQKTENLREKIHQVEGVRGNDTGKNWKNSHDQNYVKTSSSKKIHETPDLKNERSKVK